MINFVFSLLNDDCSKIISLVDKNIQPLIMWSLTDPIIKTIQIMLVFENRIVASAYYNIYITSCSLRLAVALPRYYVPKP